MATRSQRKRQAKIDRVAGVATTRDAPPARGQESLDRYMTDEKYLIRPPKKDRGRRAKDHGGWPDAE